MRNHEWIATYRLKFIVSEVVGVMADNILN